MEEKNLKLEGLSSFVFFMPIQKRFHVVSGHQAGYCAMSGREREIIYYNWTGKHFLYCALLLLMYVLHLLFNAKY